MPRGPKPLALSLMADERTRLLGLARRRRTGQDVALRARIVLACADPTATNALIVRLADDFTAYPYSAARAAHAVSVMRDNGIVGNGPNRTLGDFDVARVAKLLDIVRPVFARNRQPLPAGLTAEDLVTNAYVDPAVSAG